MLALVPEEARAWHAGAGAWGGGDGRELALDRDRTGQRRGAALCRAADGGAGALLARRDGALAHSAGAGDRAFRHGAGAQGRSGRAVRLAAAGAGRGCRSGRRAGAPAIRRRLRPAARAFGYPEVGRRTCCWRRSGCGSGPGRRGRWTRRMPAMAGDLARRFPVDAARARRLSLPPRGWLDDRGGCKPCRGKSGLHEARVPGNARRG